MPPGIEFADVSFRTAEGRLLLDKVNLRLDAGTTTAILGRSGSGKTTLLRMVNRLLEPTSGVILVNGKAVNESDTIALRRGIGYVIQETGLFPHFTIERNVGVVPEIEGRPVAAIKARVKEMLALVGLGDSFNGTPDGSYNNNFNGTVAVNAFATRYPHQLSGGQRQRAGLARALAGDPAVLLMDEPFGALDPLTRAEMQSMFRRLMQSLKKSGDAANRAAKTVLLVTHDLDEALYLAERVVLVADGRIVADLPAKDVMTSPLPPVIEYVKAVHRSASA